MFTFESFGPWEEAELQLQEAELRQEEAELQREEAELRREEAEIRREEAEIRREEAEIRQEEAEIRREEAEFPTGGGFMCYGCILSPDHQGATPLVVIKGKEEKLPPWWSGERMQR